MRLVAATFFAHPTAEISGEARIGEGVKIWDFVKIREGASIGAETTIGMGAYIDADVSIGARCKIQNGAYIYRGSVLEDGVFVGPGACLANDRFPRAITPDGRLKGPEDWVPGQIRVSYGASIGAGVIIVPDVTIGRFAMLAAGAVVTCDVPDHALVAGVRGRLVGYVCSCGRRFDLIGSTLRCRECGLVSQVSRPSPALQLTSRRS
jgi:UDP-2-acetamido-3-amino-2,3-dideoxy-glucuronate N-acetyltransferase